MPDKMDLIEISENNCKAYQAFVLKHGCFLQDFGWGDFQKTLGKNVYRFAVVDSSGQQILAALQLVEIPALRHFYLHAPYGPVFADKESAGLPQRNSGDVLNFLLASLCKRFPEAIFIRIEPQQLLDLKDPAVLSPPRPLTKNLKKTADLDPHKTLIVDLNQDIEQLLSAMHSKTRYNIKLAEKNGIKVKVQPEPGASFPGAEIFKPILQTASRAGIRSFPAEYYKAILDFFGSQGLAASNAELPSQPAPPQNKISAKVYSAWHQGDLLATNVMLYYGEAAVYLFGGSSGIKRNLMAPYLLHWQAIREAKAAGFKKYDFWGVEEDPGHSWAGISRFKFGFGGEIKNYSGTFDYVCSKAWYNIYTALRKLNKIRHRITR